MENARESVVDALTWYLVGCTPRPDDGTETIRDIAERNNLDRQDKEDLETMRSRDLWAAAQTAAEIIVNGLLGQHQEWREFHFSNN